MSALPVHDEVQPQAVPASPVPVAWWDTFEDPPGMRAEVIRGELVLSPSPSRRHQRAVKKLLAILDAQCPEDHEALPDLEWRFDERGFVAMSPRPDIVVTPRADDGPLTDAPVLAVEVLSPSDRRPLIGSPVLRIDGKILDYCENGLRFYLEISLDTGYPSVKLFELRQDGTGSLLHEAAGDEQFESDVPFRFSFRPADLLS